MQIRLGLVSGYSLLYGVHKPVEMLDRAASLGIHTVSICDLNNLYGVHAFLDAAKERNIKPIIGAALTIGKNTNPAVYCFAESKQGFSRLCELLTLRNKDSEKFDPVPLLCEQSAGLVLASSDNAVLESLSGRVKRLYAAITPVDIRAVGMGRKLNVPLAFLDNSLFFGSGRFRCPPGVTRHQTFENDWQFRAGRYGK